MKRTPDFEKGHFRASKRQKNNWIPQLCFLTSSGQKLFLQFCGREMRPNVRRILKPLSANPTKWSNTLKQSVDNLPTNGLNVFDHFVGMALKGLISIQIRF